MVWFYYQPRTLVHAGYQGTLGYVVPTAMGAQVANPDKKVVAVTGDGGLCSTYRNSQRRAA